MGDEVPAANGAVPGGAAASAQSTQDLLADIFGATSLDGTAGSPTSPQSALRSTNNDIMSLFGNSSPTPSTSAPAPPRPAQPANDVDFFGIGGSSAPAASPPQPQSYTAYEQNGLRLSFIPNKDPAKPNVVNISAQFTATTGSPISGVNFQAAVPKTQRLQMLAISNSDVAAGATETQQLRVAFPAGVGPLVFLLGRLLTFLPLDPSALTDSARLHVGRSGETGPDRFFVPARGHCVALQHACVRVDAYGQSGCCHCAARTSVQRSQVS